MLGATNVTATLAVGDIDEAKRFYGDTLGLEMEKESAGGITYKVGAGYVFVYPSQYAGSNHATAAGFHVDDVRATASDLQGKGVSFEQYDMPGVARDGYIHTMGPVESAWFKDPSGNILALDNGVE